MAFILIVFLSSRDLELYWYIFVEFYIDAMFVLIFVREKQFL